MTQKELIERWVLGDPMFTLEPLDNGMLRFRRHTIRWHQHPMFVAAALRFNGRVLMQPGVPGRWCRSSGSFNDTAAREQHNKISSACFRREVPVYQPPMTGIFGNAVNLAVALTRSPELLAQRKEQMQMAFLNMDTWYADTQWDAYTFIHEMFPELPRHHETAESLNLWIKASQLLAPTDP